MWVFYLISLPWTVGMVIFTLRYLSGAYVPRYVFFTVGYTWFCSLSVIVLVPADIWTVAQATSNQMSKGESCSIDQSISSSSKRKRKRRQ